MRKFLVFILIVGLMVLGIFLFKNSSTKKTTSAEKPAVKAVLPGWEEQTVKELGLSLQLPRGAELRVEKPEDNVTNLYIERGSMKDEDTYYQLYGIYRVSSGDYIEGRDMEGLLEELIPESVDYVFVDGRKSLQGQLKGERNRFVTHIFMEDGLFSLFTSQPTEDNRFLTDEILATFDFK